VVGHVALSQVLGALSHALDLTEGEPPGHAIRTTAIGMRLAEAIGLGEAERSALFYALLLKDAGCSANAARLSKLFAGDDQIAKRAHKSVDWTSPGGKAAYLWRSVEPSGSPLARARRIASLSQAGDVSREMIGTRCARGADIARMVGLPEASAEAIRALDEHWDGSGYPLGRRAEEIPLLGRILGLSQTVEVHTRTAHGVRAGLAVARKRAGRWFDPALVNALASTRDDRAFWARLENPRHVPDIAAWEPPDRLLVADEARMERVTEAFARVIDAKSPYTARHSAEVARWAVEIGTVMGLRADDLRDLRWAGRLHDVGKLAVSNRILDKPGRLDDAELAIVREHPRHTQEILQRVPAFAAIVDTAAAHHERLDGGGYHRGVTGERLSRPARVLAVADVYEALTAERPYRAALPAAEALGIVRAQRGTGLCPDAVDALEVAVGGAELESAA
jgi:HD-GYP domain-containing protein (c-di-GMP phosphodiesterase class II)